VEFVVCVGVRRMSSSISADGRAAYKRTSSRNSSRKFIPNYVFGSVSVACLVVGCAWTVYTNILSASVYPQLGSANFDAPAARRPPAARTATAAVSNAFAALRELAPAIAAPASIPSGSTLSFEDRFAAAAPQGRPQSEAPQLAEAKPQVEAPKLAEAPQIAAPKLAEAPRRVETSKVADAPKPKESQTPAPAQVAALTPAPAPHAIETNAAKGPVAAVRDMAQRAKAAVMSIASAEKPTMVEKLWGKTPSHGSLMSYASADASFTGSIAPAQQNPALRGSAPYDRSTAVYDISAHMVYLPDGTKLEAHSGLGSKLDDPRSASIRMHGVTPPHIYDLTPREALFHGVPALRLNPIGGEDKIFGRSGLLAHTFMLGPNGDSNGCVSFRDYNAFLNAYRNQGIKRLAVVARID
jgi:Protein of unknown function (DUF2778)